MKTFLTTIRAVAYAAFFLCVLGWLAFESRAFDSKLGGPLPAWTRFAAWAPLIVGVPLAAACLAMFVAVGRGTAMPLDPPRQFVAQGPYRYVRNPMYWGGLLTLAGLGLRCRSPGMLVCALVLLAGVHLFVVFFEEPGLERRFGDAYRSYKGSVCRWLPRIPRGR